MRIHQHNAHEFKGQTIYTVWDNEKAGGYGYFSTEQEAIAAAGAVLNDRSFYGPKPFMLVVAVRPSTVLGRYNDVIRRVVLEGA